MLFMLILALGILVAFARSSVIAFKPIKQSDIELYGNQNGLQLTTDSERLISKYLSRSRRYRNACATAALIITGAVAIPFITGGTSIGTNLLLFWLAGYLIGAILAETYNLRPRFRGPAEASLEPRTVEKYFRSNLRLQTKVVTAIVIVMSIAELFFASTGGVRSLLIGTAAAIAFIAIEVCQQAIATRARPELTPDLIKADDAIRRTAIASLQTVGLALGVLLLSWAFGTLAMQVDQLTLWAGLASVILFGWSVRLTFIARRFVWPKANNNPMTSLA